MTLMLQEKGMKKKRESQNYSSFSAFTAATPSPHLHFHLFDSQNTAYGFVSQETAKLYYSGPKYSRLGVVVTSLC